MLTREEVSGLLVFLLVVALIGAGASLWQPQYQECHLDSFNPDGSINLAGLCSDIESAVLAGANSASDCLSYWYNRKFTRLGNCYPIPRLVFDFSQ